MYNIYNTTDITHTIESGRTYESPPIFTTEEKSG